MHVCDLLRAAFGSADYSHSLLSSVLGVTIGGAILEAPPYGTVSLLSLRNIYLV